MDSAWELGRECLIQSSVIGITDAKNVSEIKIYEDSLMQEGIDAKSVIVVRTRPQLQLVLMLLNTISQNLD